MINTFTSYTTNSGISSTSKIEYLVPSFDEIRAEIRRQSEIYNSYWYYRQRVENYPSIEVQLDMLYHDILDNNLQNGKWISAIRSIKNDYPPGSGTELFFDPPTE